MWIRGRRGREDKSKDGGGDWSLEQEDADGMNEEMEKW